MSTPKHTAGPWAIQPCQQDYGKSKSIVASAGFEITRILCDIQWPKGHPDDEANARLISAAPELLEACKLIKHRIEQQQGPDGKYPDTLPVEVWSCLTVIDEAIQKAES